MKKLTALLLAMVLLLASTAFAESLTDELGLTTEAKPATVYTAEVNLRCTPCWTLLIPASTTTPFVG